MYAFFIPYHLESPEKIRLKTAIAKIAQAYRLEAQVFHEDPLEASITKAYQAKSTVFIPVGNTEWFDTVLTSSIKHLPAGHKLPTYSHILPPARVLVLQDQYLTYQLRRKMATLAARRLTKRFLYRAGDFYFLDSLTLQRADQKLASLDIELDLVNQSHLRCQLETSQLTFQSYQHAEHADTGLLYLLAQRPALRGSEKIRSTQPLADMSKNLAVEKHETMLRLPLNNAVIHGARALHAVGRDFLLPLRVAPLAEKITVIEAKNTLQ